MVNYLAIINAYADLIRSETDTPVIVIPSEVKSERFHVELSPLAHPTLVGNGRARIRLRATVFAEIPPSDIAINDCLTKSLKLANFFDETQGVKIDEGFYALAYHTALRDDDELFADLDEDRSYAYSESWLCEIEFDNNL